MKYVTQIKVFGDVDKIVQVFEPELEKKNRAGFELKKQKDHVLFEIEAEDSVALRATLNSITKLFTVYENILKVK
jgi:tRNA threonylcarbamoyladenosine modification (KEOPS) complex  Pcc1 subunit